MKKYYVVKISDHIRPTGVDFYNEEIGEMLGDEILDTIWAMDLKTAWRIVNSKIEKGIYR